MRAALRVCVSVSGGWSTPEEPRAAALHGVRLPGGVAGSFRCGMRLPRGELRPNRSYLYYSELLRSCVNVY